MPDFLLEIGCEEIPARMIVDAEMTLQARVANLLGGAGLWPDNAIDPSKIETLSTPRRLAVIVRDVLPAQLDKTDQVIGPSLKVAQKDGQPTAAGEAFAKRVGLPWNQLKTVRSAKGEYIAADVAREGRGASEILAESLPGEVDQIYWPKNMYWRKRGEVFVRPVRWLVAMLDDQVVPMELFGIPAGKTSRGHRIIGSETVAIPKPSAFVETLRAAKVLGAAEREQVIRKALDAATRTIPGARWREDKPLLATVVNLTEFPSVILGSFDSEFLELPEEVLVTVMRDHQKYFAIEDANGKLLPHFLAVLNTAADSDGLIRHGNERVLRARFNDARFFWQTDQKQTLRQRVELLKSVTFQKDLGSYYEKTLRVQKLASWLCEIAKQGGVAVRPGVVHKAACLAKTDLTTELVKEFTELQGIIGGLYARVQPLDEDLKPEVQGEISKAIYDHYKPESMDDDVPRTVEGAILSIADKADSIAGMFALGLVPSGSKDPFALRRQANGIVKTIAEHKLPLSIIVTMLDAYNVYADSSARAKFRPISEYDQTIREFFKERLQFYLRDVLRFSYDVVNSVLAGRAGADDVVDTVVRAKDVTVVRESAEFQAIALSFKRTKNILKQATEKGYAIPQGLLEPDLKGEQAEQALRNAVELILPRFKQLVLHRGYDEALREMAKLRGPLDTFFDQVMVMVEDERVRSARLALLNTVFYQFSTIADFSEIVTEGK